MADTVLQIYWSGCEKAEVVLIDGADIMANEYRVELARYAAGIGYYMVIGMTATRAYAQQQVNNYSCVVWMEDGEGSIMGE